MIAPLAVAVVSLLVAGRPGAQILKFGSSMSSLDRLLTATEEGYESGYDFGDLGGLQAAYLRPDQNAVEVYGLRKGVHYRFIALGGKNAAEVDLQLCDEQECEVTSDPHAGPIDQIDFVPPVDASYHAKIVLKSTKAAGGADVSLLVLEKVTYRSHQTEDAAEWMNGEKRRIAEALDASKTGKIAALIVPGPVNEEAPVPWFLMIARIRRQALSPSSVYWLSQRYQSHFRLMVGTEVGAQVVLSLKEAGKTVNDSQSSAGRTQEAEIKPHPAGTVISIKNMTARDVYVVAYVIGRSSR